METKILHVEVPIFGLSVLSVIDCSAEDAEAAFFQYKGKRSKTEFTVDADGGVRTYTGDVFMWVKDKQRPSIVFHELVHVAFAICEIKGIEPDEELIAYLMGWLKLEVADPLLDLK